MITGKVWGGGNNNSRLINLPAGKEYVLEQTFKGNSITKINGEWWTSVTAKTHVTIAENATISTLSSNSGLGWGPGAAGSVVDMTGGNFLVTGNQYWIGCGENTNEHGYATMNHSGGNVVATKLMVGYKGSAYNMSGTAKTNAGLFSTVADTNANLKGGTLSVGTYSNAGTTTLDGSTLNLQSYGFIDSTTGTFNATSGSIQVNPISSVSYTNGDQILLGRFADSATANAVKGLTTVPEGWSAAVVDVDGYNSVVLAKGTAPTGVKIWKAGTTGNMSDSANWSGQTSNNTGYVLSGTNTFNNFSGQLIVLGGTNTFKNGSIASGQLLAIDGGTNTTSGILENDGAMIVNAGSFTTPSNTNFRVYGTNSYLEINGGSFNATRWFAIGNKNATNPTATVVINNGVVQCGNSKGGGLIICDGVANAVLKLNGGKLQVNNSLATNIANGTGATGKFIMTNGYFTTAGNVNVATANSSNGELNISGGIFTTTAALTIATSTNAKGVVKISGGDVTTKVLQVGSAGKGDNAKVEITGGTLTVTEQIYGTGSSPSGNIYISGTGQLLLNSSYTSNNNIRELTKFCIAGSGDGSGALRFLQNGNSTAPITLTDNATIGIRTDVTFTQKSTIDANSANSVLTVKGGGTLVSPLANLGSLNKIALDNSTWKFTNTSGITNVALSSVALVGGTLEFSEGTTVSPGTSSDTKAFSVAISGEGKIVLNGTLHLDAYYNSKSYGLDKLDFTNLNLDTSEVVLGNDFKVVVDLQDPSVFYNQMVSLDWAPGLQDKLVSEYDIPLDVLNNGNIQYWWFNSDGSIFLGDANAVPEPSTWALLILGFAGLLKVASCELRVARKRK